MRGIAPEIVRTKISFDTSASFPKLQFGYGGFLEEPTQKIVDTLFNSDKVEEIIGGSAPVAAPVAQAGVAAPAAPEPQPAPAPEPVAETPAPAAAPAEEVVQTGFGAATTATGAAAPEQAAAPATETVQTGFGAATTDAAPAAASVAAPVAEEPAAAPAAEGSNALADEITALMEEVADDA